ncbi:DUF5606 domain-containing protein [Hyphobacterium sp. CCMP332]|nr:DUF5606 domain-containing protein [Hyphobacterium sp. CCMP332]
MKLNFDEIVSVAGKGGLYKILKPTKNGYIVEELNDSRKKMVLGPNHRVSLLKEISIYTTDQEGAIPLKDVYGKIKSKYSDALPVSSKDDSSELFTFLGGIVPEFDADKVYHSDVKKLVAWYSLILEEDPNISFKEDEKSAPTTEKEEKKKVSKPKPKKAPIAKNQNASSKKGSQKPITPQKKG